jgi:hypothetical protein
MFAAEIDEDNSFPERRWGRRRKVLKTARITIDGGRTFIICSLREVSEYGARLQIAYGQIIPKVFDLVVEIDGMRATCEVMWRDGTAIGVRFCSKPLMGQPLRKQVVQSSSLPSVSSIHRRHLMN